MERRFFNLFCLVLSGVFSIVISADASLLTKRDSLLNIASREDAHDTTRINAYLEMFKLFYNSDTLKPAYEFLRKAESLLHDARFPEFKVRVYTELGMHFATVADYPNAFEYHLSALQIAEEIGNIDRQARCLMNLGIVHYYQHNYENADKFYLESLKLKQEMGDKLNEATQIYLLALNYSAWGKSALAISHFESAIKFKQELGDTKGISECELGLGIHFRKNKKFPEALSHLFSAVQIADSMELHKLTSSAEFEIASTYFAENKLAEAETFALKSLTYFEKIGYLKKTVELYKLLSNIYSQWKRYPEALAHLEKHLTVNDSLRADDQAKKIIQLQAGYEIEKQKTQIDRLNRENLIQYIIILSIVILLFQMFYIFKQTRNYNLKIKEQNRQLEKAMTELKNTQAKLVQSEKMASLGQLTAGLAHEINNPVNFVSSNIRSLRRDIDDIMNLLHKILEMKPGKDNSFLFEEVDRLKADLNADALFQEVNTLLSGMEEGSKRTAEIIKELKMFSRMDNSGMKFTNIEEGLESTIMLLKHALADRIKIVRNYQSIPYVPCYPGQLNQVFMNILSNAVDSIKGEGKITVSLMAENKHVVISVKDTGTGMTEEVKSKIFEPFFTTKAVGKGTGLGLSISYGIVMKHSGTIEVNSAPGQGAEFSIKLPVEQPEKMFNPEEK